MLQADMVTTIGSLVSDWDGKPLKSKAEVRGHTSRAFTMLVNLVKPMLAPELVEQFTANPMAFLATGDQATAVETWAIVREDCNKQMVEMQALFDKKFEDSIKALSKQQVITDIKGHQSEMDDQLAEANDRLEEVSKIAKSALRATQQIVDGLEQEEQQRSDKPASTVNSLHQILADLVTTIATGAEGQIGRIRVLVMYLASTAAQHAKEAGMSESTWSECVSETLTHFRHSQEKRLKRDEIMGIARRLSLPPAIDALYERLKKVISESEYEARNFESFKFQTWARCTRHRSTNQEEKESVKKKKASKKAE